VHASPIFTSFTPAPPAVTGAGARAGVGAGAGAGAGVKAGPGEGMANPMDTPSARGALLGTTPSGQSRMGRAGSSCRMPLMLNPPRRCSQRETSPSVNA